MGRTFTIGGPGGVQVELRHVFPSAAAKALSIDASFQVDVAKLAQEALTAREDFVATTEPLMAKLSAAAESDDKVDPELAQAVADSQSDRLAFEVKSLDAAAKISRKVESADGLIIMACTKPRADVSSDILEEQGRLALEWYVEELELDPGVLVKLAKLCREHLKACCSRELEIDIVEVEEILGNSPARKGSTSSSGPTTTGSTDAGPPTH